MRLNLHKLNYILATLWLTASSLVFATPQALAASATLSLSPASTSLTQGSTTSLGIYVNSGTQPIYAVQAYLTYPDNLLEYAGFSSSDGFGIDVTSSGGGGNVAILRGVKIVNEESVPSVGSQLVATIRFKAKASAGTATVNFSGLSSVPGPAEGAPSILSGTTGANITLKPVAAKTTPAPSAKGQKSASATTTAQKDSTPPAISNVSVTDITGKSATVKWTTSEPATSEVSYGPTTAYGFSNIDKSIETEHSLVLDSSILQPGKTYHFMVKSVDPSGNTATWTDQTFQTAGLSLTVTVKDQNSKPVKGATITFQNQSVTTDKDGKATFNGLGLESGKAVITQNGTKTAAYITVVPFGTNQASAVTLKIKTTSTSKASLYIIGALALLAIVALWLLISRARSNNIGGPTVITPPPVVPGVDPDIKPTNPTPVSEFKPTPTPPLQDDQPVIIKPDNPAEPKV